MRRLSGRFALALVLEAASLSVQAEEPVLHAKLIDRTGDPCKDFYQFACGQWLKENPTPPEYAIWDRFRLLSERNQEELKKILEAAAPASFARDPLHQKIGDYYAACLDEAMAEAAGSRPLEPVFARIAALGGPADVIREAGRFRRDGTEALFSFDSTPDSRDARKVIAEADQGGLGLPDRDYYTKDDDASKELRTKYAAHVARMFVLAGDTEAAAATELAGVLTIETALARASMTRVERREPEKRYNPMSLAGLKSLAPAIPWTAYLAEAGLPSLDLVNVASPGYFKALDALLTTASLAEWKSYLRWKVLREEAPRLSSAFVDESFRFFGTTLTGARALHPRWKRCVAATDVDLRDLLGKPYVEATFGADGKARTLAMVKALEAAMGQDLEKLPWMDEPTRVQAKAKLGAILNKIGYPERWVDFSALRVERGSWSENARRAARFRFDRELAKVGKPLDKTEWRMTPPTVNASYSPQLNQITFPAGILQPPFFDKRLDDASNFGAIGAVIGHEISHGFDDRGSQYDRDGNLKDWWTEKAAAEFKRRAGCVEKQFSSYAVQGDLHVNGKLTLGENIGDLGGLKIALAAMRTSTAGKEKSRGEFNADQRFFLSWAQGWCRNVTPEEERLRIQTDPHAPASFRVNGPLSNMKEFRSAFNCPADAPMARRPDEICEVW